MAQDAQRDQKTITQIHKYFSIRRQIDFIK